MNRRRDATCLLICRSPARGHHCDDDHRWRSNSINLSASRFDRHCGRTRPAVHQSCRLRHPPSVIIVGRPPTGPLKRLGGGRSTLSARPLTPSLGISSIAIGQFNRFPLPSSRPEVATPKRPTVLCLVFRCINREVINTGITGLFWHFIFSGLYGELKYCVRT